MACGAIGRSSPFLTDIACQAPPRAVDMPRSAKTVREIGLATSRGMFSWAVRHKISTCDASAVVSAPPWLAIPAIYPHFAQISAAGDFMTIGGSKNVQLGLMLATVLSVSFWPAPASAYTPEQQQACSGDAFRLCGPEIPDVDRVTACMIRNKSQLSPGCRAFFRPGPESDESAATPAGRPMAIKPAANKSSTKAPKPKKKPAET